jgi:branched-chain amino acid transport system substrate-binding protein
MTDTDGLWQEGFFRTAHNDIFQSAMDADFAYNELGARTAAAIHDGDGYTEGLAVEFAAAFEALGGTMTLVTAINKGDTDMRSVLTTVAADSPDVLFFPIFQPEGDFIAAQSVEIAGLENTILFGADGLFVAPFGPSAGDAALDMYISGPYFDDPAVDAFLAAYEAKEGGPPPGPFGEHAYDATHILLNAIEAVVVADDDGTLHIGRQALRDEVEATTGYKGLTGILDCGPKELKEGMTFRGDCATGEALAIYQVDAAWVASEDGYPPPTVFIP